MAPVVMNPTVNAGDRRDVGWIPGSGRSPGGGHGNPLQYSCLENPMKDTSKIRVVSMASTFARIIKKVYNYEPISSEFIF